MVKKRDTLDETITRLENNYFQRVTRENNTKRGAN